MVRFKLPFMPFINILCAAGLTHYYTTVKDKVMFSKKAVKENGFVLK